MQIKGIHGNVFELLILPIESYNTPQGISPPYIKSPPYIPLNILCLPMCVFTLSDNVINNHYHLHYEHTMSISDYLVWGIYN